MTGYQEKMAPEQMADGKMAEADSGDAVLKSIGSLSNQMILIKFVPRLNLIKIQ